MAKLKKGVTVNIGGRNFKGEIPDELAPKVDKKFLESGESGKEKTESKK